VAGGCRALDGGVDGRAQRAVRLDDRAGADQRTPHDQRQSQVETYTNTSSNSSTGPGYSRSGSGVNTGTSLHTIVPLYYGHEFTDVNQGGPGLNRSQRRGRSGVVAANRRVALASLAV
jgi:hypothetical protein